MFLLESGGPKSQTVSSVAPDTFVRIEDKFFVRKEREAELHSRIREYLKPCYPDPSTRFTVIQSLYFDSPELEIFSTHFRTPSQVARFKLRTRRYAPDGVWKSDESHIELKSKKDGVSKKFRFKLGRAEGMLLTSSAALPVTPALAELNPGLEPRKLAKRVRKVNGLVEQYRLRPQCLVSYVRQAYERNEIRVTVDTDIRARILRPIQRPVLDSLRESPAWEPAQGMRGRFLADEHLVVEVKHPGQIPAWLSAVLEQVGARKTSFSKYCFSMAQHLMNQARPEARDEAGAVAIAEGGDA